MITLEQWIMLKLSKNHSGQFDKRYVIRTGELYNMTLGILAGVVPITSTSLIIGAELYLSG